MTRLIQALEKDGLVERTSNPNDKRGQIISITSAGWDRFSLAQKERLRALTAAIAALPVEDQVSLGTLTVLLKRLPDEIAKEKGRPG